MSARLLPWRVWGQQPQAESVFAPYEPFFVLCALQLGAPRELPSEIRYPPKAPPSSDVIARHHASHEYIQKFAELAYAAGIAFPHPKEASQFPPTGFAQLHALYTQWYESKNPK